MWFDSAKGNIPFISPVDTEAMTNCSTKYHPGNCLKFLYGLHEAQAPSHMQQVSHGDNPMSNEQIRHTCVPFWASSTMDGKNLFRNPTGTKSNQHNQVPKYAHLALCAQRMVPFILLILLGKLSLLKTIDSRLYTHAILVCTIWKNICLQTIHDLDYSRSINDQTSIYEI